MADKKEKKENEEKVKKDDDMHTPFVGKRKLIDVGGTIYLSIPKEFLRGNELKAGDEVLVLANTDMLVSKKNAENVKKAHEKIEEMIKEK